MESVWAFLREIAERQVATDRQIAELKNGRLFLVQFFFVFLSQNSNIT